MRADRRRTVARHLNQVLALAIAAAVSIETLIAEGVKPISLVGIAFATMIGTGVWWRRRLPIAAGLLVLAAAPAYLATVDAGAMLIAPVMLASYSMGAHAPLRRAAVGITSGLALTLLSEIDKSGSVSDLVENLLFSGIVLGGIWAAGVGRRVSRERSAQLAAQAEELKSLTAQLEREREEKARLAVAAERSRIARELHDVVAHGLSLIGLQAGSLRLALAGDSSASQGLQSIESASRESLTEMRRMLGLLREGQERAAVEAPRGLADHGELVEQARSAGLAVRLDTQGAARPLPAGVDLAAYRILQEALTNARKHASGGDVDVTIRHGSADVEIEVCSDGSPGAPPQANGASGGYGLIGMRERATLYGGELQAGPAPGGGFRVCARLPVAEADR